MESMDRLLQVENLGSSTDSVALAPQARMMLEIEEAREHAEKARSLAPQHAVSSPKGVAKVKTLQPL